MKQNSIIIAEAGVNHNGDIKKAFNLIDVAVTAGADYVKFQTFKAEKIVSQEAPKADYQVKNTQKQESQFSMLKQLELSPEQHKELLDYCKKEGIKFLSTAFDIDSLHFLKSLGMDMVKIPSGEITNLPYLREAAKLFNRVILSTGMATMEEIENALNVFLQQGVKRENITVLHCNTEYPTPMEHVNLKAMLHIQQEFNVGVGYSDHTLGIEVPIAAVALGAVVIEKHFTLDRNLPGPDHRASLEPHELKAMVEGIRNVEKALRGSGLKEPSPSEMKNIHIARKSIHTARVVKRGTILTEGDLIALRPGNGISPMEWDNIVGKTVVKDLSSFSIIKWEDLK